MTPTANSTSVFNQSVQVGAYTLPNPIAMAPLTRMRAQMPGNIPWSMNAEYYRQRAAAGLIISEATPISPMGHGFYATPGIHSQEQVEGWKLVTNAVHEEGGRIFLQLWHVGRQSHPNLLPDNASPVAPSALASNAASVLKDGIAEPHALPRALETDEIPQIVEDYRQAALRAKEAGFDGVEIHGANGYLIEQFLSDQANLRTDRYGGSLENRARFLFEVVEAVLSVWPADKVGLRLSPGNTYGGIEHTDRWGTYSWVVSQLNRYQLAYLHLVEPRMNPNDHYDYNKHHQTLSSKHFKTLITGDTKLIVAGGYTPESAEIALANGEADLIAFGRDFISTPDLPSRLLNRRPLNTYNRDTFYSGGEKGYLDYPTWQSA